MNYSSKFLRWSFIILTGIVIHFWREDIGNGLKEIIEIIYLFYRGFIVPPFSALAFLFIIPLLEGWKFSADPVLNVILIGLYCIALVLPIIVIVIFLIVVFCGLWLINWLIKWIIKIGIEGLERIVNFSPTAYVLSLVILAYILGRFFYSILFPWFCQRFKPILSLTIGEFLYYLHRKETARLMQPIYLTLAILMLSVGSWLVIISPILNYFLPPLKILADDQWRDLKPVVFSLIHNRRDFRPAFFFLINSEPCSMGFLTHRKEKYPLRKWPIEDSEILLYIPQGTLVITERRYLKRRQDDSNYYETWYQITYGGKTGWIYKGLERK